DGVVAAQAAIDAALAVQTKPVTILTERLAFVCYDAKDLPLVRAPIPRGGTGHPRQWPEPVTLADDLQHLLLRHQETAGILVQMSHGHHLEKTKLYPPGERELQQRKDLRVVEPLHDHRIQLHLE